MLRLVPNGETAVVHEVLTDHHPELNEGQRGYETHEVDERERETFVYGHSSDNSSWAGYKSSQQSQHQITQE